MIIAYGEKRIKAPSLDMNNTELTSLKVCALPHSTLPWPQWVKMVDNFLVAIGGDAFTPERKSAVLLTYLGTEGLSTSPLPTAVKVDGEDDFVFTKRRLEAHFAPKRNVCAERYRFRSRGQQSGEWVLEWVSVLRQLANTCEYGDRTDEFLRDQIIEHTSSTKLRQRLMMEGSDLTLIKSLTLAETLESAEREAKAMEGPPAPVPVQAVQQGRQQRRGSGGSHPPRPPPQKQRKQRWQQPQHRRQQPLSTSGGCWGCGRVGYRKGDQSWPAFNAKCHKCNNLHHFAQHCQGQSVVSEVQVLVVGASSLTVEGPWRERR